MSKRLLFRAATWLLTFACFYLVYSRTEAAAAREGLSVLEYLVRGSGSFTVHYDSVKGGKASTTVQLR